jgi:hypothetical protein
MNTTIKLLAILSLALAACGDNKDHPDAPPPGDGPGIDAQCSNCPAAPTLGTQIDRMGRPAISTALDHSFDPSATTANAAKNAYNADADVATWPQTYASEFAQNLAIFDVLDGGLNGNGLCEQAESHSTAPGDCPGPAQSGAGIGCGNQVGINPNGTTNMQAYGTLAGLLADDRLYLDTSRGKCELFLAVELGVVTGEGNIACGGRAPEYDVIDVVYSATAMGVKGFSADGKFTPQFGDGVDPHTDYLADFPYLGEPH